MSRNGAYNAIATIVLILVATTICAADPSPVDYVDPFIGTALANVDTGHMLDFDSAGYTHPAATLPWGMVAVGPDTTFPSARFSNNSGYRHGDRSILGFSQTHISGAGCRTMGNVRVTPWAGSLRFSPFDYSSRYDLESASPGYYEAHLRTIDVTAAMAATTRGSIMRFTFPQRDDDATILIDPSNIIWTATEGSIRAVSPTVVEGVSSGYNFCGVPAGYKLYFSIRFSKAASTIGTWSGTQLSEAKAQTGSKIGLYLRYSTDAGESIVVRTGVSYVSIENARANLEAELPDTKSLEDAKAEARQRWNEQLEKIQVKGGTAAQKQMFYTGLYHMLLHPSVFSDVNGEYQGYGMSGLRRTDGPPRYHLFSLWDTYRALHPFLALVYPDRQSEMVQSLIASMNESGALPKWNLAGIEADPIDGDPAVAVVADSFVKGIPGPDYQAAYQGIVQAEKQQLAGNARVKRPFEAEYRALSYIPFDADQSGVSQTLEYANNDWNKLRLAEQFGTPDEIAQYRRLAGSWKSLLRPETGWMEPRNADGSWSRKWWWYYQWGYLEGNREQYTFMVTHDIPGLIAELGGSEKFIRKLDDAFASYSLANEPDFHYAYLYDAVPGLAYRTQQQVRADLRERFGPGPGGLPGNDDAGATSAVLVFHSLGFYPVSPASNCYPIGSPIFDSATLHLDSRIYPSAGTFTIRTERNSPENLYIQAATLNGRDYPFDYLEHNDIVAGGELVLTMGPQPSSWGIPPAGLCARRDVTPRR